MSIPESLVAQVVAEVSKKMAKPQYAEEAIGGFVQLQPDIGRWVAAQASTLGGPGGVASVIFHASLLSQCYQRHHGKASGPVRFQILDGAARGDPAENLRTKQPALHDYLAANVEGAAATKVLATIGLALHATAPVK